MIQDRATVNSMKLQSIGNSLNRYRVFSAQRKQCICMMIGAYFRVCHRLYSFGFILTKERYQTTVCVSYAENAAGPCPRIARLPLRRKRQRHLLVVLQGLQGLHC